MIPEASALMESWQERRVDLRPGLTGPWLARDIEILVATLPAVLSGRGAY